MQISITDPNSSETAIERFHVLWEVATRKRFRLLFLRPLMGAILILIGVLLEPNDSFKGKIQMMQINAYLILSLGIVYLIYSSFDFLRIRREKTHFYHQFNKRAGGEITTVLADETVTQDHFGITTIVQWSRFSHYVDVKGFLFLVIDDSPFSSVIIRKSILTEAQLNELTTLLSEKRIEKKG